MSKKPKMINMNPTRQMLKQASMLALAVLMAFFLPMRASRAATQDTYSGESQFEADKDFSPDFIRAQLRKLALQDAISKALKDMDLDEHLLWAQYEQRFQAYFAPIQKRFQETYPLGKGDQYPSAFKLKKLQEEGNHFERSKLSKVISTFVVKETGANPANGVIQFMKLEAKVNRDLLNKVYYEWIGGKKFRQIKNLFLTVDLHLAGEDWTLLGQKNKDDLLGLLEQSWKKWLDQKLGVPSVVARGEIEAAKGGKEGEASNGQAAPSATDADSLSLKITVAMKMTQDNPYLKRRQFSLATDLLLVDLINQWPLYFEEIKSEAHEFSYKDTQELSQSIAGLIYRAPLVNFSNLGEVMKGLPNSSQRLELSVAGFDDYASLSQLKDFLDLKGVNLQLHSQILSYGASEAQLKIFCEGEEKQVRDFLQGLNNKAFGKGLLLSIPNPNKEGPIRFNIQRAKGGQLQDRQDAT